MKRCIVCFVNDKDVSVDEFNVFCSMDCKKEYKKRKRKFSFYQPQKKLDQHIF